MLRHKWFIILIALQLLNFAGMALFEQQRRSIWNREVAHTQRLADTKAFADQTQENYDNVARLIAGLDQRVNALEIEAGRNSENAPLIKDIRNRIVELDARVNALQIDAGNSAGNASLIKDVKNRVVDLDARVNALQIDAGRNVENAGLIRETRDRIRNLESSLQNIADGLQKPRSNR